MSPEAFVLQNTAVSTPSLVPEIKLHLASDALPLWHKTEEELSESGLPPPFWAFAWAGGQALARYVLEHRARFCGKRLLDLGAGSGLGGIAAAMVGATVEANEVDRFALAAIALNARLNAVSVALRDGDLLSSTSDHDWVLVGDMFYERALAERTLAFLQKSAAAGALVLIGDPSRTYLPADDLTALATYTVPTPRALEDADVKKTTVFTLQPHDQ
ncbi:MAG: 50S ribosomal protein L11 methyltransferase, partial [Pseudomonadota bacterium]